MMLSKLKLVVLVFNLEKGCHQILSLEKDKLMLPFVDLEPNLDITEILDIYYFCFINYDVKIKTGHLIELSQYNEDTPNIKKIIMGI